MISVKDTERCSSKWSLSIFTHFDGLMTCPSILSDCLRNGTSSKVQLCVLFRFRPIVRQLVTDRCLMQVSAFFQLLIHSLMGLLDHNQRTTVYHRHNGDSKCHSVEWYLAGVECRVRRVPCQGQILVEPIARVLDSLPLTHCEQFVLVGCKPTIRRTS